MCYLSPLPSARHARDRRIHRILSSFALLVSGTAGLRALHAHGNESQSPVYETVVVAKPSSSAEPREDRAAASVVITTDRTPRAAESVPEILAEQAGAAVTRLGGMGSTATLSLRGSTANQVLVYVDGVPLNTATGGGVDLGAIPIGDLERIEIYRGTSPIGFGASAIGGVVSLTTFVPRKNRVDMEAGGGSFGTYFGTTRTVWNRDRLHVYAAAHALGSEGDFPYVDTTGTNLVPSDDQPSRRRNNDLRQIDGLARAEIDVTAGRRLRASLMFLEREQGLPGLSTILASTARLGTFRATGILAYESSRDLGPGSRVRASAYGNYLLSHLDDQAPHISAVSTDARDRTYTAGGALDWRTPLGPWLSLAGVLDIRYDRFVPRDPLAASSRSGAPGTRLFGAAGIESDLWVSPLRLDIIASLRLEAARETTSGRDNFNHFVATQPPVHHLLPIARLSLIEEIAPWLSLRANAGRYARLPSLIELYGNTGYLLGNADLDPEKGLNADVGPVLRWQRRASRGTWSTAFFASRVNDLISYRYGAGRARAQNLGSARILGIETDAAIEIGSHLRVAASATFTDARDTSTIDAQNGRQLPLRPRYRLYLRPEWRDIELGSSLVLGLYADADATGGNSLDPANTEAVPRRLIFGAGFYADLPGGLRLRVSARNLSDSRIHDLANYPLPGRELYLTLAWSSAHPQERE